MKRLSSPLTQIKDHYLVVVFGSGYGGGIAASRLARAGQQVCVLEWGKEIHPGDYPDTTAECLAETQANTQDNHLGSRSGLYHYHVIEPGVCRPRYCLGLARYHTHTE